MEMVTFETLVTFAARLASSSAGRFALVVPPVDEFKLSHRDGSHLFVTAGTGADAGWWTAEEWRNGSLIGPRFKFRGTSVLRGFVDRW